MAYNAVAFVGALSLIPLVRRFGARPLHAICLIETLTMPLIYRPLLGGDPRNAIMLGGALMILGALATLRGASGGRVMPNAVGDVAAARPA